MKLVIRICLAAFMTLGLITGASIVNARTQGWSARVIFWTVFAHFALAGFAVVLAASSKTTPQGYRIGLSPAGWMVGAFASYLVGLSVLFFIR